MEDWRQIPIEDFKDLYQVSDQGRVMSYHTGTGKVLRPNKLKNGYLMVTLYSGCTKRKLLIHRLVAQAFPEICGKWFDKCQVDHINTITTDNRAINLLVTDAKGNNNNPITKEKHRTEEAKNIVRKNQKKAVETLKKTIIGTSIKTGKEIEFESAYEAERILNIKGLNKHIGTAIKGLYGRKSAGGYIWRYK